MKSLNFKLCVTIIFMVLTSLFSVSYATEFLDPDDAFRHSSTIQANQDVQLDWKIASKYSLYKDKLHISVDEIDIIAKLSFPPSLKKFDKNFNKEVEIYHDQLSVNIPKAILKDNSLIALQYQGCSDDGLCYSPIDKKFKFSNGKLVALVDETPSVSSDSTAASGSASGNSALQNNSKSNEPVDEVSLAQSTLQSGNLWIIAVSFLGFGLLLAFTPCVLPMVPILSSIIVGGDQTKPQKGFLLAVAYSLGMVMVYTSLGVAAGLAGEGLAAALQKPMVLIFFASMLFILALSMFDVYQLQLPAFIQNKLSSSSMNMQGGRFVSVFIMGALSALIVGPCVAGPLAGALIYISQSRDVLLGGLALFSMAIGMSVPLLLTGASAGALLPKAGGWMTGVKYFFGFMLIATAIWMLQSVLPNAAWMALWGIWLIACATFMKVFDVLAGHVSVGTRFAKVIAVCVMVVGVMELLGAAMGSKDVLRPLEALANNRSGNNVAMASTTDNSHLQFERISTLAQLQQKLQNTKQIVMLDFYADWCTSCIEMEKFTFSDSKVKERLKNVKLLQVDVTKNTEAHQALMKAHKVFGPPALIAFDINGKELSASRVIGYSPAEKFTAHLDAKVLINKKS